MYKEITNLKRQLCNQLIRDGQIKECQIIVHSYSNNRLNGKRPINTIQNKNPNISATIPTRADCYGICVKQRKNNMEEKYRIRKLTAKECFRLMSYDPMNEDGTFDDSHYEKARNVVSESKCYTVAGNGIVVNTLAAIFKELL